jgi:flagellar basal body-associated protein FliL
MASEKAPAAPAPPAAEAAAPEGGKKKSSMRMALGAGVVLALEIATVVVTLKLSSGPKQVIAEVPVPAKAESIEKDAEVKLIDAKLPNRQGGPLFLYDLAVVAKVADKNKDKVTELFTEREAEIRDQIRTIIASSDPKSLSEPGLETIKRQIRYQIEQDIGKDLIKEVLIPKCTAIQTGY